MGPARRASGRRVFDERAVAELAVVQLAKEAGFTLAEIRQLVNDFAKDRWRRLAVRKLHEADVAIERLHTVKRLLEQLLKCDCFDLDACGRVLQRKRRSIESEIATV